MAKAGGGYTTQASLNYELTSTNGKALVATDATGSFTITYADDKEFSKCSGQFAPLPKSKQQGIPPALYLPTKKFEDYTSPITASLNLWPDYFTVTDLKESGRYYSQYCTVENLQDVWWFLDDSDPGDYSTDTIDQSGWGAVVTVGGDSKMEEMANYFDPNNYYFGNATRTRPGDTQFPADGSLAPAVARPDMRTAAPAAAQDSPYGDGSETGSSGVTIKATNTTLYGNTQSAVLKAHAETENTGFWDGVLCVKVVNGQVTDPEPYRFAGNQFDPGNVVAEMRSAAKACTRRGGAREVLEASLPFNDVKHGPNRLYSGKPNSQPGGFTYVSGKLTVVSSDEVLYQISRLDHKDRTLKLPPYGIDMPLYLVSEPITPKRKLINIGY